MIPKRNCYFLLKRLFFAFILIFTCIFTYFIFHYYVRSSGLVSETRELERKIVNVEQAYLTAVTKSKSPESEPQKPKLVSSETQKSKAMEDDSFNLIRQKVHIFYYPWYGNLEEDSEYIHWNHKYIPNWDKNDKNVYPVGKHQPPEDVGANFYPLLGCYSSKSPSTVAQHMEWMKNAGIGVVVISWYPPEVADIEGKPFDKLFPLFLDTASNYSLKIAFHIEPYEGRNPQNLKKNVEYIIQKYGKHPAIFKMAKSPLSKKLPVFYIYDSYLNSPSSWSALLKSGKDSLRNTDLDGIFLGLVVELRHKQDMVSSGFDGFYTYFAANDFTYGSSWKNWKTLSNFARKNGLLFVPSVGPGYLDTRVRPWNAKTTRHRKNGKYYTAAWNSALQSRPSFVSVTSFNEWHEGTQIEPAVPKSYSTYTYEDYQPEAPDFYLKLTRDIVSQYAKNS